MASDQDLGTRIDQFCPYRSNYIFRAFPKTIRESPALLAVVYFLASFGVMYGIGLLTGLYDGDPGNKIRPMREYVLDNVVMGILAPVGAALLCILYRTVGQSFREVWEGGLIEKSAGPAYGQFLARADRLYNSRLAFFIALGIAVAYSLNTFFTKTDTFLRPEGGITGYYGRLIATINFTMIFLVIYKYFVTIWALQHVLGRFEIKISPLHPDRAGGLRPLGSLAMAANNFMALVVLIVTLMLVFDSYTKGYLLYYILLVVCYPVAIASFFASLAKAHRKMRAKKEEVLGDLARTFDHHYQSLKAEAADGLYEIEKMERISSIESMYAMARRMPVWPFDAQALRRFFTSFALPLIILLFKKPELIKRILTGGG